MVKNKIYLVFFLLAFATQDVFSAPKTLYDLNNSGVMNLNAKNFYQQITLNRSKDVVSIVHYYKMKG